MKEADLLSEKPRVQSDDVNYDTGLSPRNIASNEVTWRRSWDEGKEGIYFLYRNGDNPMPIHPCLYFW